MAKTVGKKMTNGSTYGKIYNAHLPKHTFCGIHNYFIILLDGCVMFVSYLPFIDYSTISSILQSQTDEQVSSIGRPEIMKTQFVPRSFAREL